MMHSPCAILPKLLFYTCSERKSGLWHSPSPALVKGRCSCRNCFLGLGRGLVLGRRQLSEKTDIFSCSRNRDFTAWYHTVCCWKIFRCWTPSSNWLKQSRDFITPPPFLGNPRVSSTGFRQHLNQDLNQAAPVSSLDVLRLATVPCGPQSTAPPCH